MKQIGNVGWGGNSGYSCLNMVAQLYPKKIILIGYDMTKKFGDHWHEPHSGGLGNPTGQNIERWRRVMEWAHIPLAQAGITTINCSPISSLKKYPKMTFREALDFWLIGGYDRMRQPYPPLALACLAQRHLTQPGTAAPGNWK
jgi:hypothetical protein